MPKIELPPVTDAHRRAAFVKQRWPSMTYEQAIAIDLRRRIIEACAHQIRTQEFRKAERHDRSTWCLKALFAPRTTVTPILSNPDRYMDYKRAAAHDLDD